MHKRANVNRFTAQKSFFYKKVLETNMIFPIIAIKKTAFEKFSILLCKVFSDCKVSSKKGKEI